MISKISFFKMVRSDMKRRMWVMSLLFLGFFVVLPLSGLIQIGNYQRMMMDGNLKAPELFEMTARYVGADNRLVALGIVLSAVLAAFTGFSYLHSRKKLDLFHSLPVRREVLFGVQYVSGFFIFLIPYSVNILLMLIVCITHTVCTAAVMGSLFVGVLIQLLYFLLFYHVVQIAIFLTGRILVSVSGTIVFLGYVPLLQLVLGGYYQLFFDTFYSAEDVLILKIADYLSPFTLYNNHMSAFNGREQNSIAILLENWSLLILVIAASALTFGAAAWLYKRRPSEAALRSMVWPKSEPVIKVLLITVISAASGLFFRSAAMDGADFWVVFGILFGAVITHGIVEVTYSYEFKKVLSHKVTLLASTGAVLLMAVVFRFDIFGYDTWLPGNEKIASLAVSVEGLDDYINYYSQFDDINGPFRLDSMLYGVNGNDEYRFKYGQMQDTKTAYSLVTQGVKNEESDAYEEDEYIGWSTVSVEFRLNSGAVRHRRYHIRNEQIEPSLQKLYDTPGFKEGQYPLLRLNTQAAEIKQVELSDAYRDRMIMNITKEEAQQLLTVYQAELKQASYDDMRPEDIVGTLDFYKDLYMDLAVSYCVYESFTETCELLQSFGYHVSAKPELSEVSEIAVYNYTAEYTEYIMEISEDLFMKDSGALTFRDPQDIQEILDSVITGRSSSFYREQGYDVYVTIEQGDTQSLQGVYYAFREGRVPDSVEEAFEKALQEAIDK